MEIAPWGFTVLATFGSWLAMTRRMLWCWKVWTITNSYFVFHNLLIGEYAQCAFFAINLLFSIKGWKSERDRIRKF